MTICKFYKDGVKDYGDTLTSALEAASIGKSETMGVTDIDATKPPKPPTEWERVQMMRKSVNGLCKGGCNSNAHYLYQSKSLLRSQKYDK
jgi:hypothetical protein